MKHDKKKEPEDDERKVNFIFYNSSTLCLTQTLSVLMEEFEGCSLIEVKEGDDFIDSASSASSTS